MYIYNICVLVMQVLKHGSLVVSFGTGSVKQGLAVPTGKNISCNFSSCILEWDGCWAYLEDEVECSLSKYTNPIYIYRIQVNHSCTWTISYYVHSIQCFVLPTFSQNLFILPWLCSRNSVGQVSIIILCILVNNYPIRLFLTYLMW